MPVPAPSTTAGRPEEAYNRLGVPTFANYVKVSTPGPKIPFEQVVQVLCKVYDPNIASVTPAGYWYRIGSAPWNGTYYAAANTFLNGVPPTSPTTIYVDPAVPDC